MPTRCLPVVVCLPSAVWLPAPSHPGQGSPACRVSGPERPGAADTPSLATPPTPEVPAPARLCHYKRPPLRSSSAGGSPWSAILPCSTSPRAGGVRGRAVGRRTHRPRHQGRNQGAELAGSQAVFALVWFRESREVALIGRGLGISQATAYRYLTRPSSTRRPCPRPAPDHCTRPRRRAGPTSSWTARSSTPTGCGQDPQPQGQDHRRLVLGQDPRLRRQHPGPVPPRRAPGLGLHGRTGRGARPDRCAGARPRRPLRRCRQGLPTLADPGYDGAGHGVHTPVNQPADKSELTSTPAPATRCCAHYAAWANAASRCSPDDGAPSSTSPSVPARSARSPKPHSSSPTSSTATSLVEKTSVDTARWEYCLVDLVISNYRSTGDQVLYWLYHPTSSATRAGRQSATQLCTHRDGRGISGRSC